MNNLSEELLVSPLTEINNQLFQSDQNGDLFIPLSTGSQFQYEDLIREGRPAFSIGTHVVADEDDTEKHIQSILSEGLLSPARYGVLSTDPLNYFYKNHPIIMCSTFLTWTKEFMATKNNVLYSQIYEPLIGISDDEAKDLSSVGRSILTVKHSKRVSQNHDYIWRYIPPTHILAVINASDSEYQKVFPILHEARNQFRSGQLTEEDVAIVFQNYFYSLNIDIINSSVTRDELAFRLASAITETEILTAIHCVLNLSKLLDMKQYVEELRILKPSYQFTTSLLNKVREVIQ